MGGRLVRSAARVAVGLALVGAATARDIRIVHVYDKTGPLEAYARQTQAGLLLGLEYATGGSMKVGADRLVLSERDSEGIPEVAKAQLAAAYGDDGADLAIGPTSSSSALAMLPVAEEHRKLLLVEPAVADSITGERWNRYVFRTGRNSSQEAIANAIVLDRPGTVIATLAQDYAYGHDGVKAFRTALKSASIVHEEYLPAATVDFTAGAQRLFAALKDKPGRKIIFIIWAGAGNPFTIADLDPKRLGIEIAGGGNILPAMTAYKRLPGMEGATYYYYDIPKNPANAWLVAEHRKRFGAPPDFFTAGGMTAAMALVEALKRTGGNTDSEKLIAAMEGMPFDTPKGRMIFRREDHQAMQSMYGFRIRVDPALAWGVPELTSEIRPENMDVPIQNAR